MKNPLEYKSFTEARNHNIESLDKQSDLFDTKILWLSAGSFGLILTFLTNIVKPPFLSSWLLISSLFCFA